MNSNATYTAVGGVVPKLPDPPPQKQKELQCLLCLTPVKNHNPLKINRQTLRSTSQRLFEYICSFLDIEVKDYYLTRADNRSNDKSKRKAKLNSGNFPLCPECNGSYYKELYSTFVAYEDIVASLSEKISKYVTKAIAISAAASGGGGGNVTNEEDEHEMMSSIRKIREKVLEKNVMAIAENCEDKTEISVVGLASTDAPVVVIENVNVKQAPECVEIGSSSNDSDSESGSMDEDEDDEEGWQETHNSNYSYMVAKPAPGVIHIIPTPATISRPPKTLAAGPNMRPPRIRTTPAQGAVSQAKKRPPMPPQFAIIETFDGNTQKVEQKRIRVINKRRTREDQIRRRICKFCNLSLPSAAALLKHEVSEHGKTKPEKCEKCDYRCLTKANMRSHMDIHLDNADREKLKPFQCNECGAKFQRNSILVAHIRTHTGIKPFCCEICKKAFACKESMKLCLDKHNGIKNHQCPFCQKRFLRSEVLKIHVRTHTFEKPFACQKCYKRFAQRAALRAHLKVHDK